MRRFLTGASLALLALVLFAGTGHALPMGFPQLRVTDQLGNSITVDINGVATTTGTVQGIGFAGTPTVVAVPATGSITVLASVATAPTGWSLTVNTGQTKPGLGGSATNPSMDLQFNGTSLAAGTLTIEFTDGDYGPVPVGTTLL